MAFQCNPICDATLAEDSFEKEFNKMKSELQQDGVHVANLTLNLRNSKDIGEVSRNIETFTSLEKNNNNHSEYWWPKYFLWECT